VVAQHVPARADDAQKAGLMKNFYETFMARYFSKDRETCIEQAHDAFNLPRAVKLTAEQGLECIAVTGMPTNMMDKIGAYCWRALDFNFFPSWRVRNEAKAAEDLEMVHGVFYKRIKDATGPNGTRVAELSYAILKHPQQCVVDRTKAFHKKGMLVWEHGMRETSTRTELLAVEM
jgi:hypothetical protein